MRSRYPNQQTQLPVSLDVYQQLQWASCNTGYQKEDWEIAAEAIDEWMRRHKPDALAMQVAKGYQWKSQFLPTGTLLRTVFGGKNYHCLVEGDQILYNSKAVSPSGFVNAVGGIRRNAWRSIWILFPDSKDWKLADTLRNRARPRRVRKPADEVQQALTPQPSAGHVPVSTPPVAATASASEAPYPQQAIHEQVPRDEQRHRQQPNGITLARPGFMRATDHRTHADERVTALLRQELLPLLYRMCALDAMAP